LVEAGGQDLDGDGIVDIMIDSDGDEIPDDVDVDQTLGADADADGIDDRADIDFLFNAIDTDGDGIADFADADPDGNGFANALRDVGVSNLSWPDTDQNGVPDVEQPVVLAAAEGDIENEISGQIETGLNGQGCSVDLSSIGGGRDPSLPTMLLLSLLGLLIRSRLRAFKTLSIAKLTKRGYTSGNGIRR